MEQLGIGLLFLLLILVAEDNKWRFEDGIRSTLYGPFGCSLDVEEND